MPLTAAEWLKENNANWLTDAKTVEAYAQYYHAELSRPPKDVVDAINAYEDVALKQYNDEGMGFCEVVSAAALHGYSLASGESVAFAEWLTYSAQPKSISKQWWILNADRKEYTTSQLFDLFKKESNG